MFEQQPTLQLLFEQLGLDADDASIENFIKTHQLPAEQKLHEASFWSQGQSDFLKAIGKKMMSGLSSLMNLMSSYTKIV